MILDHVGIAVPDIDKALELWRDALGATVDHIEDVAGDRVRVAFLSTGETATELLEPIGPESPIARFLASGRHGLHHIAYRVADIEASLEHLRTSGYKLIDSNSRPGSRGTRVAFVHPKSAGGVLLELVQYS